MTVTASADAGGVTVVVMLRLVVVFDVSVTPTFDAALAPLYVVFSVHVSPACVFGYAVSVHTPLLFVVHVRHV
ncbi:MAG TPA: hypothetical protein VI670_27985, partial [Thermoanaerobaculia bacterium]